MALDTFTNLKASIADWLNRSDLTNVIPDFITLAESQLNRELRHYKQQEKATASIDTQYSATPSDWLQTVRFHLNDDKSTLLKQTSPEEIAKLRNGNSNAQGKPEYFSHVSNLIEVWPSPDSSGYTGEILYYAKIQALSSSNETNWLLTMSPDVYLFGSLLQAAPYLQNDDRMAVWGTTYQNALNGIMGESDNTRYSASNLKLRIRSY